MYTKYQEGGMPQGAQPPAQEMSKEEKMAMMLDAMAPEDIMMLREMIDAKMESETGGEGPASPEGGGMVRPQPMMRRGVSQMG